MGNPPRKIESVPAHLCCPACKGALAAARASFSCVSCGLSFPVTDKLPILLAPSDGPGARLKERIARYYDRAAESYESGHGIGRPGGSWSIANKYLPFMERHIRSHDLMLEIGAGTGALTQHLRKLAREVVPTDLSPGILRHGRALGRFGFAVAADAEALPFRDSSFDAVVAVSALSYCPGKGDALREIHRVLKPGGRFLLIDMNYLLHLPYHLVALAEFRKSRLWLGSVLQSTPFGWRRRIRRAGFTILEQSELNWIPHRFSAASVRRMIPLDAFLSNLPLVRKFAMRIAIAAERPAVNQ